MKKILSTIAPFFIGVCVTLGAQQLLPLFISETGELMIPTIIQQEKDLPLKKYALQNLSQIAPAPSLITLTDTLQKTPDYTAYLFQMDIRNKTMSGQVTIPTDTTFAPNHPIIVMLRGYVAPEDYSTGTGTKNAAAAFAKAGYITVAPDFFGYGQSDPEPSDSWLARFEKPVLVADLLASLQTSGIVLSKQQTLTSSKLGIWAHSNGGQIALSTLIGYGFSYPTTLWAPVTAPFPYSVLFFSDELADEGKSQRKWISMFEEDYNSFDFSLTQHLDTLKGPLQLHHGETDDAALIAWSDEFMVKISSENEKREKAQKTAVATNSATPLPPIEITYHRYPDTDHNMQPSWNTAIARDITFFKTYLPLP